MSARQHWRGGKKKMGEAGLLELDVIHDTFVSGVGSVQIMGPNARITLYSDHDGRQIVVTKIVIPIEAIPACINAVIRATWKQLTHIPLMEIAVADRVGRH